MGGLFILDLQNVIAELGFDDVGGLAGASEKAALSNSGTVLPGSSQPSSPPWVLLPGSTVFAGEICEVAAALDLLQQILRPSTWQRRGSSRQRRWER